MITTQYDPKPMPDFSWDWSASVDGEEEWIEYGPTEVAALKALCERLLMMLDAK